MLLSLVGASLFASATASPVLHAAPKADTRATRVLPRGMRLSSVSQDAPVVMGLDSGIGRGFDLVSEYVRAPLFQWNYEEGQVWENPWTNETVAIPDELFVTNTPHTTKDTTYQEVDNWETYQKATSKWWSIDVGYGVPNGITVGVGFTRSRTEVEGFFKQDTRNFCFAEQMASLYQLDTWFGLVPFSPVFEKVASELPSELDASSAVQYKKLLDAFGTHVIVGAQYGGTVNVTTAFDKSLYETQSSEWVSNQVGLTVSYGGFQVGLDFGIAKAEDFADHDFLEHSESETQYLGGDPNVLRADGYEPWLKTLPQNPAILLHRSKLLPIYEAFLDPAIRANVEFAMGVYVNSNGEKVF